MNKKDYNRIIKELNKRLNTDKFNFGYCGGTFKTTLGKVDINLHEYDRYDKIYSIYIKFYNIKKLKEYGVFHYNEYNGKANIHSSNINNVLNMIAYYIF